MILIGRYASPFVRRVAVALQVYRMQYRLAEWSAFTDLENIVAYNPLGRVPVLVLDSGEALIETSAILDHLDRSVGEEVALIARDGAERRATLRVCALASGFCDKLIGMIYERRNHETPSASWLGRCEAQAERALCALERERAESERRYWFGERLSHADIAVACAMTFLETADAALAARKAWPALARHRDACEALAPFKAVAVPGSS